MQEGLYSLGASGAKELSHEECERLAQQLTMRADDGVHLGYALHGTDEIMGQSLVVEIPEAAAGKVSVCGAKDFLIDEWRKFPKQDGGVQKVRCASAAVLEMTDAPIHVHGSTLEHYIVLEGRGKMVLGTGPEERVVEVQKGSVVLLLPGQAHGIASDDPEVPIKALLTFAPGLAPKEEPEFRDEKILYARTSERLKEIMD